MAATARRIASCEEIFPAESRSAPKTSVKAGQAEALAQLRRPVLQRGDVLQAGLVQFPRGQRQRRVGPDRPCVVGVTAGQPGQARLSGRPRAREQFLHGGHPPGQRRVHHLRGGGAELGVPLGSALPARGRARGQDGAVAGGAKDILGPRDGLLRQRGDGQPAAAGASLEALGDLIQPGPAATHPRQVAFGRRRVHQDRPGRGREEDARSRVVHGGDRVVLSRHVDHRDFLGGGLRHAAERDGVGRGEPLALAILRGRDGGRLAQEVPCLSAPGLLPFLAGVREQVVIPPNAVHRGGERVGAQPARVETIGEVTACGHRHLPRKRDDQPKRSRLVLTRGWVPG